MSAYVPGVMPYIHQEFPKWVHSGETLEARIVQDAEEFEALIGQWFDFKHEAEAFKNGLHKIESEVDAELQALIAQAEELAIKIDKRWSVKRLRDEIDKALDA